MLGNFIFNLFSIDQSEKMIEQSFRDGRKLGYEEGIKDGMSKNFERTKELTESEYQEIIKFLIERGLELCCYDVFKGGFAVRKISRINL